MKILLVKRSLLKEWAWLIKNFRFHLVRKLHLLWFSIVVLWHNRTPTTIKFCCNICGGENAGYEVDVFDREKETCQYCRSNLRARMIIDILLHHLLGEAKVLVDIPVDKTITGLGVSDWQGYSEILSSKFSYVNTFFHKEPTLDIANIHSDQYGKYDFVIVSEVFEHIDHPVSKGFENMYKLMKPNGLCIVTVPFMNIEKTLEHFPDLYLYEIIEFGGEKILLNKTMEGKVQVFTNLSFHGGAGATLEKRIFTRRSIHRELLQAGFTDIVFHRQNRPQFGINSLVNWSLPISAIKK